MSIPTKRYIDGVPYSDQEFWGVKFGGKDGWDTPDDAEYDSVRKVVTGTTAVPSVGGLHTWDDWEAHWTDVTIGAPDVETYTVDIPGRHGLLDLSEVLTGAPVYKNREIEIELTYPGSGGQWHEEYSDILEQVHGRTQQLVFDSDPGYYYEGRCTVSSQRQDNFYSTFTITMDANPFKYLVNDSLEDWLWDPFSFEDGVIRELGSITLNNLNSYVTTVEIGTLSYDTEACIKGTSWENDSELDPSTESGRAYLTLTVTARIPDGDGGYDTEDIYSGTAFSSSLVEFTIPAGTEKITMGWWDLGTYLASIGGEITQTFALYFREKRL